MDQVRIVDVAPERLARWCETFGERHGGVLTTYATAHTWELSAGDGEIAAISAPFPPVDVVPGERVGLAVDDLVGHGLRDRLVAVLLVRLGAHAAGIFDGTRLVSSKVDRAPVHGRSKAGGWSQQRFARRRERQARESLEGAAAVAARVLLPEIDRLDAVVLGGDRRAIDRLRRAQRLSPLFERAVERFLAVPEPRLSILRDTPQLFRAARVQLRRSRS